MSDILSALFRTIFFYFLVVFAYRIMGKREISQLEVIDLIVSILMAELIAISIENINDSIILAIVPIIALVFLEVFLSKISLKIKRVNEILSGKPSMIIINGKIKIKELIKNRYSLNDLLLELRQNNIKSIKDVEYAVLEPNGKLSIFKYNILRKKSNYPMPLIIDTEIQYETLKDINKSKDWLIKKIHDKGLLLNNIFYAFYDNDKIYIIDKNV